ncbi:MAG: alpha-amylase family protein [Cyclobacteriaceae bacterium]|nr:alpha-amylase family protein [Cyclobacteriaceae bacterium]
MKNMINWLGSVVLLMLLLSCGESTESSSLANKKEETERSNEASDNKKVIYQVFTRTFGNQTTTNKMHGTVEENGTGKFNDFTVDALEGIKELGVTHIWYTGVIAHATATDFSEYGVPTDNPRVIKGRAGSPYAIKDYYDVNPDLAEEVDKRMDEFEGLVKRTHQRGMKVIIDFVPNHVARSYQGQRQPEGVTPLGAEDDKSKAFDVNNHFYYLPGQDFQVPAAYRPLGLSAEELGSLPAYEESPAKATGNDVFSATPSVNDWFETIKLNYGVDYQNGGKRYFSATEIPDTWERMKEILLFWAGKGVDGFRCDMAEMVPVEFWEWVSAALKEEYPDIILIAEIYNPEAYEPYIKQGGFDYLYDKVQTYDSLRNVIQDRGTTKGISASLEALVDVEPHMLRFLENHDEQRIASSYFAGDAFAGLPALAISNLASGSPFMLYFGQEVGEPATDAAGFSDADGRSTIFDYFGIPEHQKWMNDGAFDGGKLSEDQLRLRALYQEMIRVSTLSRLANSGPFTCRLDRLESSSPEKTHSFSRENDEEEWYVVTNFSDKSTEVTVKDLSADKAQMMFYWRKDDSEVPEEIAIKDGNLKWSLDPYATLVFSLRK